MFIGRAMTDSNEDEVGAQTQEDMDIAREYHADGRHFCIRHRKIEDVEDASQTVQRVGEFITNSEEIAERLKGGYHPVKAITEGIKAQMKKSGRRTEIDEVEWSSAEARETHEFRDNMTGKPLEAHMVRTARQEEMDEVNKHQVYDKVPIEECWAKTGKAPIGTRWVDINKGDDVNPEYRSRLVAKEINTGKRDDLFAATPPLEAKKALLSMAVTEGIGFKRGHRQSGKKLDFIDIRRAYFHAKAEDGYMWICRTKTTNRACVGD